MKRTFIAQSIPLPESLKARITELRSKVQGVNVNWVELHNMHLTLAFLGDTSDEQIEYLRNALRELIPAFTQYKIRLKNTGVFRSLSHPQVLWIGIEAENTLLLLYREIQDVLANTGFEKDSRPFKPHLTIGRIKNFSTQNNLKEIVTTTQIDETVYASTIVYYQSILKPSGPLYQPIESFSLKKK